MTNKSLAHSLALTGILPVNKPKGKTSFSLVQVLRSLSRMRTIGHAGTLDPFASGVMILLIGKEYTRLSDRFLNQDKEYEARICLGTTTSTYDPEGEILTASSYRPGIEELERGLLSFQGEIHQVPPMYSAKKVHGTPLYKLARRGKEIERKPIRLTLKTTLIAYDYPYIDLNIRCSKGTYVRSLAHDLGQLLQCGAYLFSLIRTRSGSFSLCDCLDGALLYSGTCDYTQALRRCLPEQL
ncbi:MAG: tRNA pseudouridine(55) synthase TruB [Chlamydiae bacterium GWC2_50_10]|nr:MAG: tRNA pseudouridine(55) synthase TruB [Chlamydiae bacterium GWA2_50_15]OGN54589.1 MAG: tRNA pseudouridine(55) synthase TruB [Chlamydiae bacterium GWC2_50_10]OGN57875.1 MAG: tRNA pseudouridine(55) synthase TruB [Chlamydiae bacterium RIFCSPHIGHO2_02_FULL_49_29]OGN63343.1 MAG: tRNA pseudouridine(55) synthase TruB [Chlamydiae bacterium RIFCSPHIGHO2_12_FULL_49_32]OGN69670.1 MAG: tRNA pseudouridine(55) synthase TruB [Chlamydiae bacterium RIFCSPLOWO2_02_FULL_49_12]OGN75170.1 MAG: tRNA pseudour